MFIGNAIPSQRYAMKFYEEKRCVGVDKHYHDVDMKF